MNNITLPSSDIQLGEKVESIFSNDVRLNAGSTLWWYEETKEKWLYIIATPLLQKKGFQAAYLRARLLLSLSNLLNEMPLDRILIVDESHQIIELFRSMVTNTRHIQFADCIFDGITVKSAHIYKISKRCARTRKRKNISASHGYRPVPKNSSRWQKP